MPRRTSDWRCPQCKRWSMAKFMTCRKCGRTRARTRTTTRVTQRVHDVTGHVVNTLRKWKC